MRTFYFTLIIFFIFTNIINAKEIFLYTNNNENEKTEKKGYKYNLLKLALDKTIAEYGDYILEPAPVMNKKRAIYATKSNEFKKLILNAAASKELLTNNNLRYINFPISRGIFGYRVAFISPLIKDDKSKYDTLEKIKKLRIGQGKGWLDNDILIHNGFNVKIHPNHRGLLSMIQTGRIDLFLRSIYEIKYEQEKYDLKGQLEFDKSFLIYYPLPKFIFVHKSDEKLLKRIEKGLILAYEDGSLDKLFNDFFKKYIDYIKVEGRKLYKLENPYMKDIEKNYNKYYIDLFKEN